MRKQAVESDLFEGQHSAHAVAVVRPPAIVAPAPTFAEYWGFDLAPALPFLPILRWHRAFHAGLCNSLERRAA